MKIRRPDYYTRFCCLASGCRDTCCAGWEICIDPETAARYRREPGEFGERLRACIDWGETPSFRLSEGERCPFLNPHGLCDIYIHLGEDALCEICAQHPRFHAWYGDLTESGLGLCCEAAAALILDTSAPARFETLETPAPPDPDGADPELLALLCNARETAFALAQNRDYHISERFALLAAYGAEIQDCLEMGDGEGLTDCAEDYRDPAYLTPLLADLAAEAAPSEQRLPLYWELFDFLLTLEPISPAWPEQLRALRPELPALLAAMDTDAAHDCASENLAVYFLFRYLLKSAFDEEFLARMKLCILLPHLIRLLGVAGDGSPSAWADNARACSKELEYSEQNLAALLDFCAQSPTLLHENLLRLLLP